MRLDENGHYSRKLANNEIAEFEQHPKSDYYYDMTIGLIRGLLYAEILTGEEFLKITAYMRDLHYD